jgi:hypothetical protein
MSYDEIDEGKLAELAAKYGVQLRKEQHGDEAVHVFCAESGGKHYELLLSAQKPAPAWFEYVDSSLASFRRRYPVQP